MAASYVGQAAFGQNSVSGTSWTVTASANTTAGNLLVLVANGSYSGSNPVTITDSQGNTWTKTIDINHPSGSPNMAVAWCIVAAGKSHTSGVDTFTGTWTTSLGSKLIQVNEFAGIAAVPLDKSASATGTSSATPSSGATATTVQADELLVGAFGTWSLSSPARTFTAGSGYTIASSYQVTWSGEGMCEYQVVSATGAYSAGCTMSAAVDNWLAAILTFKAAATGVAPVHEMSATGVGQ
jgi:hypothetical protein